MNRDEFLNRFENQSTKEGYLKSFKKLDLFLDAKSITEDQFLLKMKENETYLKYDLLQELIEYMKNKISPGVVRNYFDNIFTYLLLNGAPLDYTQKKLRLKFPRIARKKFEGLDRPQIITILNSCSPNFKAYISGLVGGGFRESELGQTTPDMFLFNEYPVRVKIPAEIAKFSIQRETFLPPIASRRIKELIETKAIPKDKTIFSKEWNQSILQDFTKYFAKIRTRTGLDTPGRQKQQQNDITLHSFRAYFITTFTNNGLESFGHALSGHTRYMETYYRNSLQQRQRIYASIMNQMDFDI